MEDPSATLKSFDTTLSALETAVAPLFDQSLNSLRDDLGGIDRAKLDVLLAYAINNLVWSEYFQALHHTWLLVGSDWQQVLRLRWSALAWHTAFGVSSPTAPRQMSVKPRRAFCIRWQLTAVYLKTRGVNPDDHDVTKELVSVTRWRKDVMVVRGWMSLGAPTSRAATIFVSASILPLYKLTARTASRRTTPRSATPSPGFLPVSTDLPLKEDPAWVKGVVFAVIPSLAAAASALLLARLPGSLCN